MKRLLLACCLLQLSVLLYAQDSTLFKRNIVLKTRIVKLNDSTYNVHLADINDTSLIVTGAVIRFRSSFMNVNASGMHYSELQSVVLRRKGSTGRGILFGALGGAVAGGIIGAVTYKECDGCFLDFGIGFSIATGSILGTLGGGLVGGILGALAKKIFIIGGNKEKFQQMKLSVLDMAYRQKKTQ